MSRARRLDRGFSLLEMAVALMIVGLLLGGLLGSVGALEKRQRSTRTEARLEEARDAMVAFAVANRRLPCPADPGTPDTLAGAGLENAPTAADCTDGASGVLPWATLDLPAGADLREQENADGDADFVLDAAGRRTALTARRSERDDLLAQHPPEHEAGHRHHAADECVAL
jgi:prepilin-type N-terminal cleavage/methylation domain-containing protein